MAVPSYDHVVIVMEENHGFGDIIGSSAAPYINSLANGGALLTNYFADTHPSEPNYMIIYAGSDFGIGDDKFHAEPDPSLATKVQAIGKTFVGYAESGSPEKHNPWEAFPEGTSVEQDFGSQFPTTSAGFAAMPALSFVIPNLNNDMHDGTIQQADTWLRNNIDAYAQWAKTNNSLLIVTWDEDDSTGSNQVAAIFYGAHVVTGQYGANQYDHFNMCATLAALVGASPPRTTAAPISEVFSAAAVAPSVPTGLQAPNVTANSITLSWGASTGTGPITYNVLDRVGATGSFVTVASGVSGTSSTVGSLNPNTTYNFEVIAVGPGGTSAPSTILSATTLAISVAPSVPTGLQAANVTSAGLVLSWNASTGTAPITYNVLDRIAGTGSFVSVVSGVSGTSTSISSLNPGTSYDFEVTATGPGGTSAPSAVLTVATVPSSDAVVYILEESSSSSGPWTAVQGSPFSTTTDTIGGLQASTAYFFRITAQDILLGISSPPTVVGPIQTNATSLSESPQNTRISSPSVSAVPPVGAVTGTVNSGSLIASWGIPIAIYDASLSEWTMFSGGTSSGVQVASDGTVQQNTSNVQQLVYWNHTVYYEASTQNQLSVTPGWWYLSPLAAFGSTQVSQPSSGPTPVFDDEFTSGAWMSHQQWQSGDTWEFSVNQNPGGSTTGQSTWWIDPIATPAAASLYQLTGGALKLGVMTNPGGLGISESLLGTIINNQNTPGGCYRVFGYYEFAVTLPNVPGFFFGWDIEDHLPGLNQDWSREVNIFVWIDTGGTHHVWFQIADSDGGALDASTGGVVLYQTTSLDVTKQHSYGFDWQSDAFRCYIDGSQVGSPLTNPGGKWKTEALATYIYTNGADYGGDDGTPSAGNLPAWATLDYYRIYATRPTTTSGGGGTTTIPGLDWIPVLGDPALTTSPQQTDVTDTVAVIIGANAGTTGVSPVTGLTATVSGSSLNVSWNAPVAGDTSHSWQLSSAGQVLHNGVADTGTTGTVELLFWANTVYRKTNAGAWLSFNGSAWVSAAADPRTSTTLGESPDGTFVPNTTWRIVDATGAIWKLVGTSGSYQIDRTGVSVQAAANVVELLYSNHTVYQATLVTISAITPGSGSITDIHGNVWTLDASGNVLENGTAVPGGGGTGALTYVPQTDTIYARDQSTTNWFTWNGSTWVGPGPAPPATSGLSWSFWNNGVWTSASGDPRILSGSTGTGTGTGTGGGTSPPPPPPPSNNATFFDDFNTLNMYNIYAPAAGQTWQPAEDYDPLNQGFAGGQAWVLNPFNPATPINNVYTVSNSILSMRDILTPSQFLSACGGCQYIQAQLKLSHFFSQTYGYFEARMAVQQLVGTGAGFLLYSTQGGNEIDVIQIDSGPGATDQSGSYALYDSNDNFQNGGFTYDSFQNFDPTIFHQYGVDVQPSTTTFYIDRVQVNSFPTPSGYNVPLYPNIYMGLSDPQSFFGSITSPGSMPITAQFDYVGIWTTRPF